MTVRAGWLIALAALSQCLFSSAQTTYLQRQTENAPWAKRYDSALVSINWANRNAPADWRTLMVGGAWGPHFFGSGLVGGIHFEYQHWNDVWVSTTVDGEPTWTMLTEFTGWTPVRGAKMAVMPLGRRYAYKVKTNQRYEVLLHIGGTMEYYPTNEVWSSYDKGYTWELLQWEGGSQQLEGHWFTYPRFPHAFQERAHHGLVVANEPRIWNNGDAATAVENKWGISVACAYVFGGAYERDNFAPIWRYYNDVWAICPNSIRRQTMYNFGSAPWSPRSHFGVTAYNEGTRIAMSGGRTGKTTWTNEVWTYDVYRKTWAMLTTSPTLPNMHQPALVVSASPPISYQLFYIMGSQTNEDDYTSTGNSWASTDLINWIPIPDPITPRRRGAQFSVNPYTNKMTMVGGTINAKPFQEPWATGAWRDFNFSFFNEVWTTHLFQ